MEASIAMSAKERVPAIDPVDCRTAAAGHPLVAWKLRIAEIGAPRALEQIAPEGCHVAKLLRSTAP